MLCAFSRIAEENGGDGYIFVSSKLNYAGHKNVQAVTRNMKKAGNFTSTGNNENPLSVDVKMTYLNKMYPEFEKDLPLILPRLAHDLGVFYPGGHNHKKEGLP